MKKQSILKVLGLSLIFGLAACSPDQPEPLKPISRVENQNKNTERKCCGGKHQAKTPEAPEAAPGTRPADNAANAHKEAGDKANTAAEAPATVEAPAFIFRPSHGGYPGQVFASAEAEAAAKAEAPSATTGAPTTTATATVAQQARWKDWIYGKFASVVKRAATYLLSPQIRRLSNSSEEDQGILESLSHEFKAFGDLSLMDKTVWSNVSDAAASYSEAFQTCEAMGGKLPEVKYYNRLKDLMRDELATSPPLAPVYLYSTEQFPELDNKTLWTNTESETTFVFDGSTGETKEETLTSDVKHHFQCVIELE